jgi:hypothetical protein
MMDLPARLADILAQHLATTREINRPVAVGAKDHQRERPTCRLLLPADQQRACVPPRIGAPVTS